VEDGADGNVRTGPSAGPNAPFLGRSPLGAPEAEPDGFAREAPSGGAPAGPKHVFSWDDFELDVGFSKRYALWRDVYGSRFGAADFAPSEERPYSASGEFVPIGGITVVRLASSMAFFRWTTAHVAADGRDDVMIGFNSAGAVSGRCGRKEIAAPAGGMMVYTNAEPLALTYHDHYWAGTGVSVPRATLANLVPGIEDSYGVVSGKASAAQHLLRYAELLLHDECPVRDPALDVRIETMLLDLIALMIGARKDVAELAKERGLRAARLAAIKEDIRENMGWPGFSIAGVAKRQGVSPRYIHILFEAEGKTFTEYVHERRLNEAYRMLVSPAYGGTRIGDIAFAVGFSEQSTFNRLFRQAFGATPSEIRHVALGAR
jgi:AraC-like DNA-binding protein